MKTIVALLAALLLAGPALAHPHHRPRAARHARHRPQTRAPRSATLAERSDEIVLSRDLLSQLQRNLAAAGYLDGTIDGRLTRRTRRALAAFQRDYHMAPTGALDLATARALLGSDVVDAYLLARQ